MFTREDASRTRQEFWTVFGKYMMPVLSSEGEKINWVNYRTGVKEIYFRMETGAKSAAISISIEHTDPLLQEFYYDKFAESKKMLRAAVKEPWKWQLRLSIDGKVISKIYKELPGVSVLNKDQWPDLISFFKPRIIALDGFWENAKYGFE